MPVFREKPEKLKLEISSSSNLVKIKVDCFYRTIANVSFDFNFEKSITCGQTVEIDAASKLKGKSIAFNGAANNPNGETIKIIHTIWEESGNLIEYTFPDDYTGEPLWDTDEENPSYKFQVNFI